jgi:hypothetical protein
MAPVDLFAFDPRLNISDCFSEIYASEIHNNFEESL